MISSLRCSKSGAERRTNVNPDTEAAKPLLIGAVIAGAILALILVPMLAIPALVIGALVLAA